MDEVDIDNVDDLNELEARLYAQIHHEASETSGNIQSQSVEQTNISASAIDNSDSALNQDVGSATNRALSKRYWASGAHKIEHQPQQNTKYQYRNSQKQNVSLPPPKCHKEVHNPHKQTDIIVVSENSKVAAGDKATSINTGKPVVNQNSSTDQHTNKVRANTPAKAKQITPARSKVANKTSFKNPFVRSSNTKDTINAHANPKQGPFFKQQQKLEKAKRIENKKQKAKRTSVKIQNTIDVVDLISSDESDSSDVVVIPVPPPPTFTVDDSDDGGDEQKPVIEITESAILEQEENALDSTDVQMSTSSSFVKPQQASVQNLTNASGGEEKRVENSSRCTSPCSIQSSDDFIGQTDRSRLQEPGSGMADDEDLLLLTSDVNSLLEAPQYSSQSKPKDTSLDTSAENVCPNDSSEFATPKSATTSRKADYRVDEGQFRALDVYESESDITDSVYSKGTTKTTVIRQIGTSSDEVEDISCPNPRTKRLRKRRRSSGNKSSDANNEINISSSENNSENDEDEGNSGADRTGIPFISRGPAVERKTRKRSRTLSTSIHRTPTGKSSKSGHMSDGDFIAKLNDLVQGQEGDEFDESDETENAPSAREIAAKILGETKETVSVEEAVPSSVCNQLTDVFEVIDHMEEPDNVKDDKTTEVSTDKSDSHHSTGQQKALVYKSLPEDDNAQILKYVDDPNPSSSYRNHARKRATNGAPIYNVIYSRVKKSGGGLGWNDEMRKFYENSWNGEVFVLSDVWQKMNPDRTLWRIYNEDRYNVSNKRHNNLKCTNCCEFGHARYQCKRPMKPLICYMCGESGHLEPRCPNTICLRCGNKTQVFIKGCNACSFQNRLVCPICKIRGHSIDFCPDKWRRYHSTTEPNSFPNNTVVYNPRKYCSICGHRGHLADACRNAMHFMEYPSIATSVKSHQKSYSDMSLKAPFGAIGLNLMYEPCLEYSFDMAGRTTSGKYYGRFLNAVGMSFLLSRKRSLSPQPIAEGSAKKSKKSHKRNVSTVEEGNAPNQVQEITESGRAYNERPKESEKDSPTMGLVESTVQDDDIQLNIINVASSSQNAFSSFKSPNKVTSLNNPPQIMDSDSNYSFSEHFDDVPSTSNVSNKTDLSEMQNENTTQSDISRLLASKEKPKSREMETLPEFIPLVDSTGDCEEGTGETKEPRGNNNARLGISRRFVAAESEEEYNDNEETGPVNAGYPCEAKIYLTHLHSKYLLSPDGRNFLKETSKSCELKSRLDFTSVGHVLVIFGLPDNQDKFQRELLLKYRELSDHINQTHLQPTPNVPKRTDVLIRFLRDDINQLLSNIGNVNHLFNRLQYVERQQSKSGFKSADKIRRSLNMILVGQAGLQDGNMHLDKLLASLKTLINDYSAEDVTPLSLRSEITSHWKVIFSPFRHDNYQDLVDTYNKLISKNRMPKLIIDPLLLGHKILDTTLTDEQKEKLEQPKQLVAAPTNTDQPKKNAVNSLTPKTSKQTKRKQGVGANNSFISPITSSKSKMSNATISPAKTPYTQSIRSDNNSSMSTPIKTKSTASNNSVTPVSVSRKPQPKIMPPPPFVNPENRSTVTTELKEFSDKCRTTCDTILTEITAKSPRKGKNALRESKLPSTFWSRESMRYLDECVSIVVSRQDLMEKIKRVQNKSKNGQLSYNDYLAVIKLHTALTGK